MVSSLLKMAETDQQIAEILPSDDIRDKLRVKDASLIELLETVFDGYAGRPALGERDYGIAIDPATGSSTIRYQDSYKTISYGQLQRQIHCLASAWQNHPIHRVAPDEFVCIFGFASADFLIVDFACYYTHAITVPLQSSTSGADLDEILDNVAPVAFAATTEDLLTAAEHATRLESLRSLIVFDYDERDDEHREKFKAAKAVLEKADVDIQLIPLDQLVDFGSSLEWVPPPHHPDGAERMAALIHSSGSTGKPKGAVLTEKALRLAWRGRPTQIPCLTVLFAPLNHGLGRNTVSTALIQGGTVNFTLKPDMSTLFEDIRLVRPTTMTFFPRIFEMIYQHYQNEVARCLREEGEDDKEAVSARVKREMGQSYLGDRLRNGAVGSAPTSPAIMDFIKETFGIFLTEAYGNTEMGAGAITRNGWVQRPPIIDYKLRDVPELGYYTSDKPYPRGELCFKSVAAVTSYYKQPEATAGLLDEEGFSITGDIVEEREKDYLVVIDRRKDVLKLSQGEYVALGTLGTVLEAGSPLIKQIYVYGNSLRAYLLAAIVPEASEVKARLGDTFSEADLKSLLRGEIKEIARREALKGFEVPRDFIIEYEPFSQENGLLSSVRKKLRPALQRKYGATFEVMYDEQERLQENELAALKDPNSPLSTAEKLSKLLEISLSVENIDLRDSLNFGALGGDSLGAVMFSQSIEEIFGVPLPADVILSPTGSVASWSEQIDKARHDDSVRATFQSIHGDGAEEITADQLQLDRFIDDSVLQNAKQLPAAATKSRTVLLTGGNGFLGHIVCLEWLEKLSVQGGKVICLVRGKDNQTARARLDEMFIGQDPALESRYKALAENHLEVLAGDAAEERLGLSEETYNRLASEVDRISHVAALVNHRFSYQNLFGPNVAGTAEIIRLALTTRKKTIDFVSTQAVYRYLDPSDGMHEDSPLKKSTQLSDDAYAAGYGASKWAAELLLQRANQQFGLAINTFRGNMMLPHQKYSGEMNVSDMFTRLLYSLIETGLAPYSFYPLQEDGSKTPAHYDGTPVDIVAAAVAGVTDNLSGEYRTYNIHNYHADDGCSLDAFVDWIESAGYPLTRLDDHQAWYDRFNDKLTSLPEAKKQKSALEIMGAYSRPLHVRSDPVSCHRFRDLISKLSSCDGLPHVDETYIHKCLQDLVALGYIDEPA